MKISRLTQFHSTYIYISNPIHSTQVLFQNPLQFTMHPDNQIRTKYCSNCKKRINFTHFDVHETVCKSQLETTVKPRRHRIKDRQPSTAAQNQQVFPCHLCGYNQTLQQLDTHCKICPNRQVDCSFCSLPFPTKMMDDHLQFCPQKPIKTRKQYEAQINRIINWSPKKDTLQEDNTHQVPFLPSRISEKSTIIISNQVQTQSKSKQTKKTKEKKKPQYLESFGTAQRKPRLQRASKHIYVQSLRKMRRIVHELEEESSSRIESLASRNNDQSAGLRKEEIRKIQERQYKHKKGSELQDCSICCCVIVENHLVKDLPCKHLYHAECLSKWLAKNTACPLCKFDISTLLKPASLDKTIDLNDLDETEQTHILLSDEEYD